MWSPDGTTLAIVDPSKGVVVADFAVDLEPRSTEQSRYAVVGGSAKTTAGIGGIRGSCRRPLRSAGRGF